MRLIKILLFVLTIALVWSVILPKDYFTWGLEVFPAFVAIIILWLTYKSFKLTPLLYVLITIHCCILFIGGHYTYAEVPFFDYLKDLFDWDRNNYDKVGHFAQGFIPAIITRELLIRKKVVNGKSWLNFLIVSVCMAISVSYEFLEWGVSEMTGESAESFLGTQGYIWDTQSDMLYATIGAISALVLLSKTHDNQLKELLSSKE